MKNQKRHGQASEDDRLPLRVPTRCPIFSRNWASSPAPPTPSQPLRGWRRQAGWNQSTAGLLSRSHPSDSARNAMSRRAKTIVSRSACLHDAQFSQEIGHRRTSVEGLTRGLAAKRTRVELDVAQWRFPGYFPLKFFPRTVGPQRIRGRAFLHGTEDAQPDCFSGAARRRGTCRVAALPRPAEY